MAPCAGATVGLVALTIQVNLNSRVTKFRGKDGGDLDVKDGFNRVERHL